MPMTATQQSQVLEKLRPHLGRCAVCAGTDWEIGGEFMALVSYDPATAAVLAGGVTPLVVGFCQKCGHMLAFSSIKLGLTEQEPA